jgi:hypothetical protein
MTVFKIAIDDNEAEDFKEMLREAGYFRFVEEEFIQEYHDYRNSYNRIRKALDNNSRLRAAIKA